MRSEIYSRITDGNGGGRERRDGGVLSFAARFDAACGLLRLTDLEGEGGLLLIAKGCDSGARASFSHASALALLVDLSGVGLRNAGMSATNAAGQVAATFSSPLAVALRQPATNIEWVELDSECRFDRLICDPRAATVKFSPLLPMNGCKARSAQAFLEHFSDLGRAILQDLAGISGFDFERQGEKANARAHE